MARFIISHRLAGKVSASAQDASRAAVDKAAGGMRAFASVAGKVEPKGEATRKTLVVDCDPRDMEAKRADFDDDVMVEAEAPRLPAALYLRSIATAAAEGPAGASAVGIGALLNFTLNSQNAPVAGAQVTVLFGGLLTGASTSVVTESDAKGKISVAYDPRQWYPKTAIIMPKEGYWSWWQNNPYDQLVIELPALPKSGPVGWWHQIMGVKDYSETRGRGIRVGVVDTGVGPHPYLAHVQSIGAFINGSYNKTAAAGPTSKTTAHTYRASSVRARLRRPATSPASHRARTCSWPRLSEQRRGCGRGKLGQSGRHSECHRCTVKQSSSRLDQPESRRPAGVGNRARRRGCRA